MELTVALTGLKPDDIGKYVLLPGDPARSNRVSKYLDNVEFIGMYRKHLTFTGYYKGVKVSVTSAGLGCPSASIATQELINIGTEAVIRIGSSAALDLKIKVNDLLISTSAMKNEGTSVPMYMINRVICNQSLSDDWLKFFEEQHIKFTNASERKK